MQFCKDNGLKPRNMSLKVANNFSIQKTDLEKDGIINKSKNTDLFRLKDENEYSNEIISPQKINDELETSEIGREIKQYIEESCVKPKLVYGQQYHNNRGMQIGDNIEIYMSNINSVTVAAQTVIHEMTHYKYGIGNCQWAEAVCMAKEKMHITKRMSLNYDEMRMIVQLARDNYSELNWKKGGDKYGKRI